MLQLERADGSTIQYRIPFNTLIFKDRRMASWNDIKMGDEVRILLQTSGNQIIIGEITIISKEIQVDAVYRADFFSYDKLTNSIVVTNMRQFKDGIWNTFNIPAISKFDINDNYSPNIPRGAGGTVYMATGKSITEKNL